MSKAWPEARERRAPKLGSKGEARFTAARGSNGISKPCRGWGKPNQPHAGEDGDVSVTLRTITDDKP